ncbi:MAG: tRNA preQ1(34) S-adenosylmethionine ribosyltransferase-isomerase QueA [bacterium]|nr:tRNA preQ1(34) S-adenosylmethionine ribosyltransferase-isomerase QueA [bacterium]
MLKTSDFDFDLPNELIAQKPIVNRDEAKMLVIDKNDSSLVDKKFYNIVDYLEAGDCLVLNDSKVLPARLIGIKVSTKAVVEILLLNRGDGDNWKCLVKPAKRIKLNDIISFGNDILQAKCIAIGEEGIREFSFKYNGVFYEILDQLGEMPLPPYIKQKITNHEDYQTVYAKNIGSVAAPTAGLHFTDELLTRIRKKGVNIVFITLHVGLGTFRPVSSNYIDDHHMHSEYYEISSRSASTINDTRRNKKKIIAVGTTVVRTLETVGKTNNEIKATSGWTNIFIKPGYQFKVVDAIITNFHLPKSTLLMLVSTFSGIDTIRDAYHYAIKNNYKFFSFGDCTFLK